MPSVKTFTRLGVERLKPPKGKAQVSYFQTLERGVALVLVVGSQTKTWRCLTYSGGKAQSIKLGRFPQLQPDAARKEARKYFENPRQAQAQAEADKTFRQVAEDWFKRHAGGLRSKGEIERYLHLQREPAPRSRRRAVYIPKSFLDRKIAAILSGDVFALLDGIEEQHGTVTAERVLGILRQIMRYHEDRNETVYTSPISHRMKRDKRKAKERARRRVLDDGELRALWNACEAAGSFGRLLQLCLLTAQRRGKVSTMRWSDLEGDVWKIAAENGEKGTAGKLPLPKLAREVIAKQTKKEGNPFVFPGKGKVSFNAWSQGKAELDEALPDMQPWVIHDLRRTARTRLSALTRPDIAERILGHELQGIQPVYDLHTYEAEMGKALEKYARTIERIVNPPTGNVVHLDRANG